MKRLTAFLLAAVLLLTVAGAATNHEMNIAMLDSESALVEVTAQEDAGVVCAFYSAAGRLLSAHVTEGGAGSWDALADIPAGAARLRCFLLNPSTQVPLCDPLEQSLPGAPVETVTSGVSFFGGAAFNPESGRYYIGYELDDAVTWFENGAPVERVTQDAARGDVVELYDEDGDGLIDLVRVYRYAVGREDGEVILFWQHPTKDITRTETARRVVGRAVSYQPSTGILRLENGTDLRLSGIRGAPVTWGSLDELKGLCSYYLDKDGAVCRFEPFHGGIDGGGGGSASGGGSAAHTGPERIFLRSESYDVALDGTFRVDILDGNGAEGSVYVTQEVYAQMTPHKFCTVDALAGDGTVTAVTPLPTPQRLQNLTQSTVTVAGGSYRLDVNTVTVAIDLRWDARAGGYVYRSAQTVQPGELSAGMGGYAKVEALVLGDGGLADCLYLIRYTGGAG